jgi:hypothetical protein
MSSEQADLRAELLDVIAERTSPDEPWISTRALVQIVDGDTEAIKDELNRAANSNELLEWRGQFAPVEREHLVAVIEAEKDADVTRQQLIARTNRLVREVSEDGE